MCEINKDMCIYIYIRHIFVCIHTVHTTHIYIHLFSPINKHIYIMKATKVQSSEKAKSGITQKSSYEKVPRSTQMWNSIHLCVLFL